MANTIRWTTDDSGLTTDYYIYRSTEQYVSYSKIAEVAHPSSTYVDPTGQDYHWYRISAYGPGGESPLSVPFHAEGDTYTLDSWTYTISHSPGSDTVYIVTASGAWDYNSEYNITIEAGLESEVTGIDELQEDYSWDFTSTYYPIYTNPTYIRTETGNIIAGIPDDTLYRMILKNTWLVEKKAEDAGLTINRDSVPMYMFEWVVCKTKLDAINAVFMGILPYAGSKRLGDLTVDKKADTDSLDAARKDAMDCLKSLNSHFTAGPTYAVPAINDTTRIHPTRDMGWGRFADMRVTRSPGIYGPHIQRQGVHPRWYR